MLVGHPTPAMCSITGSVRAGKEVAAAAAPNLTRTHLELGGKAPVVVFADADLKKAAADIALAAFFNAGQVGRCTHPARRPPPRCPAGGASVFRRTARPCMMSTAPSLRTSKPNDSPVPRCPHAALTYRTAGAPDGSTVAPTARPSAVV